MKRREGYFECPTCSALVWDIGKQTRWHEDAQAT